MKPVIPPVKSFLRSQRRADGLAAVDVQRGELGRTPSGHTGIVLGVTEFEGRTYLEFRWHECECHGYAVPGGYSLLRPDQVKPGAHPHWWRWAQWLALGMATAADFLAAGHDLVDAELFLNDLRSHKAPQLYRAPVDTAG